MKSRKRSWISGFVACTALVLWIYRADLVLAYAPLLSRQGESDGQWLRDSLILCGPSSISPTIAALRRESPWARIYCYLPGVLRHFGEPAHQRLLQAIDAETNRHSRDYLISALQESFKDFTRFHLWLADSDSASPYAIVHMAGDIRLAFPAAPPLKSDSSFTLNPDFLVWWQSQPTSKPKDERR